MFFLRCGNKVEVEGTGPSSKKMMWDLNLVTGGFEILGLSNNIYCPFVEESKKYLIIGGTHPPHPVVFSAQ
jgi:hypothetical protein